jgi:glutaredoxin
MTHSGNSNDVFSNKYLSQNTSPALCGQCETAIRFWSRKSIEYTDQAIINITGEG